MSDKRAIGSIIVWFFHSGGMSSTPAPINVTDHLAHIHVTIARYRAIGHRGGSGVLRVLSGIVWACMRPRQVLSLNKRR